MGLQTGLIGIGAMGQALLQRLVGAGHAVRGYTRDAGRAQRAGESGAVMVRSAAEAASGAAFIHVFVGDDAQTLAVCLGEAGALAGAPAGSVLLLHSTILPATTRDIAAAAAARGIEVLDAPVTAVPARVAAGEAVFLVGGADNSVAAARPHLLALGKELHHFGPLGAGNAAKLAKNMVNAAERVLMAEALAMTEAAGIEARQFLEMLKASSNGALAERWERAFTAAGCHAEPLPTSNLFDKDIQLAADYAQATGLALPLVQGAAATGRRWMEKWRQKLTA